MRSEIWDRIVSHCGSSSVSPGGGQESEKNE